MVLVAGPRLTAASVVLGQIRRGMDCDGARMRIRNGSHLWARMPDQRTGVPNSFDDGPEIQVDESPSQPTRVISCART